MLWFILMLFSQLTVTSGWIVADSSDVAAVMNPMVTWAWSLFNLVITFAWVIVIAFFIGLLIRFVKSKI